jgi:hypothetical protein
MTAPDENVENDDSVLEQLGDVVDVVLAEDIAPAPEDAWERRQRLLDSWTAIILAVAAVATAWASFQASQWSGAQSDNQSASAMARSDAGRASSEATAAQIVDSQMWLSWLNATANRQADRVVFYRERFSPTLAKAQDAWIKTAPTTPTGGVGIPPGTPMDLPVYVVPAQAKADSLAAAAEADLAKADQASSHSTKFVLLAVLFALVLFFASVATKFSAPKVQVVLILVSLFLLAVALLRMLFLPVLLF